MTGDLGSVWPLLPPCSVTDAGVRLARCEQRVVMAGRRVAEAMRLFGVERDGELVLAAATAGAAAWDALAALRLPGRPPHDAVRAVLTAAAAARDEVSLARWQVDGEDGLPPAVVVNAINGVDEALGELVAALASVR